MLPLTAQVRVFALTSHFNVNTVLEVLTSRLRLIVRVLLACHVHCVPTWLSVTVHTTSWVHQICFFAHNHAQTTPYRFYSYLHPLILYCLKLCYAHCLVTLSAIVPAHTFIFHERTWDHAAFSVTIAIDWFQRHLVQLTSLPHAVIYSARVISVVLPTVHLVINVIPCWNHHLFRYYLVP